MEWGYRYKKLPNGQTSTQRDKTHHSHQAESAEYAASYYNAQGGGGSMSPFNSKAREIKRRDYAYV